MRLRRIGAAALATALGCSHAGRSIAEPSTVERSRPEIILVEPSGSEVPANLLRISIRFETGVEGPVLSRLTLSRTEGSKIHEPFLEQELWSADGKVLTLLMHPGRVKTGLKARAELGPILAVREDVTLSLDGVPIKQWRVGTTDESGPITSAWKLSAVQAESQLPLVVTFDGPIDGQATNYLAIADVSGHRVAGRARLTKGESSWTFTPDVPWRAGAYKLVVRGTLEDSAGNRLGSRFETSIDSPPVPAADAVIPFVVSRQTFAMGHRQSICPDQSDAKAPCSLATIAQLGSRYGDRQSCSVHRRH
jgi:hypothetical protein